MKYPSLFHRLAAQVEINEHTGCWTWTGPTRRHGGGERPSVSIRVPGGGQATSPKNHNAARLMCEIIHGPAPISDEHVFEASHLCPITNWLCVCPDHLLWETKSQNNLRRIAYERDERAMGFDYPCERPGTIEAPF